MRSRLIIAGLMFVFIFSVLVSSTIEYNKHNLSTSGPGSVVAQSEEEICIFCHSPHKASSRAPLWNHDTTLASYNVYNSTHSSTLDASTGQPDGSSVLCLSCHDGTVALGSIISRTTDITMSGGVTTMPSGYTNLGTDLRDDHPISFVYNSTLQSADGELKNPNTLTGAVKLDANSKMQCMTCHNPHNDDNPFFLNASAEYSALCLYCHNKDGWSGSTHKSSTRTWNASGTDPWPHTPSSFTNVAQNGCENCHNPHSASGSKRLLNSATSEGNCLVCHNGNVAQTDIQTQLNKTYNHPVIDNSTEGNHDPTENARVSSNTHVECVDCHNPHQTNATTATAPNVNGYLLGLKGVNSSGSAVTTASYEYEICYRCHAYNSDLGIGSPTTRLYSIPNIMDEFNPSNPSHHAVVGTGENTDVPSLIAPWDEADQVYCSDCHASDGSGSPDGPHGSTYAQILVRRYDRGNYVTESAQAYALCYGCHSRASILGDNSFSEHNLHIVEEDASCNTCHDPHGVQDQPGTTSTQTHLINFNTDYVTPVQMGRLYFHDDGYESGRCYLRCHGRRHMPKTY